MKAKTKTANKELQALAKESMQGRMTEDLLHLHAKGKLDLKTVTAVEIDSLAYDVKEDEKAAKMLNFRVKAGKEIIMEWMKLHKITTFDDVLSSVRVGARTQLEVLASVMLDYLKRMKKTALIDSVLGVKLTEAKKYFGSDVVEQLGKKEVEAYASLKIDSRSDKEEDRDAKSV